MHGMPKPPTNTTWGGLSLQAPFHSVYMNN